MREHIAVGVLLLALVGWGPATAVGSTTLEQTPETRPTAQAQPTDCDFTQLYDETIGSVVTVQVRSQTGGGIGSGFVYDDSGHIVTNQHVVANASAVEVQFDRGEWATADVIGTDVYSDLAVLEVNDTPDYADPLAVNGSQPEPGRPVAALGSPLGLRGTITNGIVSGTNRSLPAGGPDGPTFPIPNTIQTTAAINPGNSGGPLVNCQGQVVGVNTAGAQGSDNTGFAVPASRVERVVPALVQNGSYANSYLGVSTLDVSPIVATANDLNVTRGVLVVETVTGSPAAEALRGSTGTRQVDGLEVPVGGDVILSIDGQRINSAEDLGSVLTQKRPGETVTVTVLRNGQRVEVRVVLARRPQPGQA
ncbi:S1C family serine protease [Halorussus halophilus]|uniref:S1C family serine protease n=1 Tax=Halorussus halophilus TaxID=2650975 RepID=UPI001301040E|nr:trypsin-like peptidase domain-containing protein [Halorussus halophilus]